MLRNKIFSSILLLGLLSTNLYAAEAPEMTSATIDRSWGLLLGDEVVVTSVLPVARQNDINEDTLPARGQRLGHWLYLKKVSFEEISDAPLIMRAHYQVVNTAETTKEVGTPEFTIRKTDNSWLTIPAVPMMLSSLLPAEIDDLSDATITKPDRTAPQYDIRGPKQRTLFWGAIAAMCFLLSLLWLRLWGHKNRQPFDQALVRMKKFKNKKDLIGVAREIHHAFNATAGETIVQGTLNSLFISAPRLTSLREEITAFYNASAQSFFNPAATSDLNYSEMLKLVKACRNTERLA